MVHWPACGGRPRRVHSQNSREPGIIRRFCADAIVRLSLIVCSPVRRLRTACPSPSPHQQRYRRHAVIGCVTRRISMINTSKLALIAVLAAMSVASPAFAQSFNKGDGTGNELPFAYGPKRHQAGLDRRAAERADCRPAEQRRQGRRSPDRPHQIRRVPAPAASTTTPRFRSPPAPMPQTARRPPAAAAPATMKCFCATEASTKTGAGLCSPSFPI